MNNQNDDFTFLDKIAEKATGNRIKRFVQNAGYSQSQIAEIMEVSKKTIANYYSGKSLPDKRDLIKLSRILGIIVDELLVFKGDLEGYQRLDHYLIQLSGKKGELIEEAIKRSKTESKLFYPNTKSRANIRNLEEVGYCMQFFSYETEQDIRNRIMDELFLGNGTHSINMYQIYEHYIWIKLTDKQKEECKKKFSSWRGEVSLS